MTEAKTVLYKRKNELETRIRRLKEQEASLLKELKGVRSSLLYRQRLLQEIMDVYNTLVN